MSNRAAAIDVLHGLAHLRKHGDWRIREPGISAIWRGVRLQEGLVDRRRPSRTLV
jgi:hypothetical protein